MNVKVLINGMGVLGRKLFRTLCSNSNDPSATFGSTTFQLLAVNDPIFSKAPPSALAYLLRHDSAYGEWLSDANCYADDDGSPDRIFIYQKDVYVYGKQDPAEIPLGEMGVGLVFDCTGTMTPEKAQGFINAGANKVVIMSETAVSDIPNIVYSINSNSSTVSDDNLFICSPAGQVIADSILANIVQAYTDDNHSSLYKAYFVDVGSYTNANNTQDTLNLSALNYSGAWQLGRAGAWNLTRTERNYAEYIGLVVPALNGKCTGNEIKNGTIRGSISYGNFLLDSFTADDFYLVFKSYANDIIAYSDEGQLLTSSDLIGSSKVWYCGDAIANNGLATIPVIYDPITLQISNAIQAVRTLVENNIWTKI